MKTTNNIALLSAGICFAASSLSAETLTSASVIKAVKAELATATDIQLAVVTKHVSATPEFSCEIVKTVISETNANPVTIATIVETAAVSAPEQIRLIAQCAIAIAPDSASEVQMIVAKLDVAAGDDVVSGKEVTGKQPVVAAAEDLGNPLDFPTGAEEVVIGPAPGAPGGRGMLPTVLGGGVPVIAGNPKPATDNETP